MISLLFDMLGALSWFAFVVVTVLFLSALRLASWMLVGVVAALRKPASIQVPPRRRVVFRGDRPD